MSYLSRINTSNVRYVWFWFSTEPHKNHQRKCAHYFSTNNMMMWFCLKGNSHHGNKTKQKRVKSVPNVAKQKAAREWRRKIEERNGLKKVQTNWKTHRQKIACKVKSGDERWGGESNGIKSKYTLWNCFPFAFRASFYLFYYPRRLLNTKMSCFFCRFIDWMACSC